MYRYFFKIQSFLLIDGFVKKIKYVLDQLRTSLLKKHQSNKGLILARKRFIKMFRSWSASYRVVLSANILDASFMMNAKSFIIRRRNSGPKTLSVKGPPKYFLKYKKGLSLDF